MRIITGTKRGKKLLSLEGESVRPTTDRVKEALFDILQFSLEGRRFLDLFAGSGQIGLEAVSRGAEKVCFVDSSKAALRVVEKNIALTGFSQQSHVFLGDFETFLSATSETFDIAFLDPPYRTGLLERALPLTVKRMAPGGTLICEHPRDEELPERVGAFQKQKTYRYGRILLSVYRKSDKEKENE